MAVSIATMVRRMARFAGIREGYLRSDLPERFGIPSFIPPDPVSHWRRVMARSREMLARLPAPTGPRIALVATVAKLSNNHAYATVLAHALRLRGADAFVVYCDSALDGCERTTILHQALEDFVRQGPHQICHFCYPKGEDLLRVSGIPAYPLSAFLDASARQEINAFVTGLPGERYFDFSYKGVPLGLQVEATVARFLFSHAPKLDAQVQRLAHRFVRGAVTTAEAVLRMCDRLAPEVIAPSFGAYVSRGTAWEVARARGVRSVPWGRGDVEEAMVLGLGANAIVELAERMDGPWLDVELTLERVRRLDRFLRGNIQSKSARAVNLDPCDDEARLRVELALDPGKPIVALYTNCGFDSKFFYSTPLYPDTLDWTFDTIEIFRNRREQLVIRVHPYEAWIPQIEQTAGRIAERFPVLPENVRVVPPEHKLNSYTLGMISQAVTVYGSQIGLELAAMGRPVIVAGRSSYRRKGFTYDVHTREEYVAFLNRLDELARPNPERTLAARCFAYYYYCMRPVPFAFYNHDIHPGLKLRPWWKVFRRLRDLEPGRDPNLDAICNQILYGREALAVEGGG
jgi:hypothetical protein